MQLAKREDAHWDLSMDGLMPRCQGWQGAAAHAESRHGRDTGYPAPPAQIPACGFVALGSSKILASVFPALEIKLQLY